MSNESSLPEQAAVARAPVVVIPAYQPGMVLVELAAALSRSPELTEVIVVNDGSGPECAAIFSALAAMDKVQVLHHAVNLGKGAALKTAMNYAACTHPAAAGVVTADADGQHAVEDILRLAEALRAHPHDLVLGARDFRTGVPLRSKAGNLITRYVLWAITGQKLSDTQTGLRAIPMDFIGTLLRLPQNGYEFELEMLLASKRALRHITQIGIETIYRDGNRGSHFNPVLDSMRIYFLLMRFTAASLMTAGLDNLVFIAVFHFWPQVLGCQVLGRGVAGLFNYYVNKTGVFHSRTQDRSALPRYWSSVILFGALSYVLIQGLHSLAGTAIAVAKPLVETALFGFSFIVQREFVFFTRPPHDQRTAAGSEVRVV